MPCTWVSSGGLDFDDRLVKTDVTVLKGRFRNIIQYPFVPRCHEDISCDIKVRGHSLNEDGEQRTFIHTFFKIEEPETLSVDWIPHVRSP